MIAVSKSGQQLPPETVWLSLSNPALLLSSKNEALFKNSKDPVYSQRLKNEDVSIKKKEKSL